MAPWKSDKLLVSGLALVMSVLSAPSTSLYAVDEWSSLPLECQRSNTTMNANNTLVASENNGGGNANSTLLTRQYDWMAKVDTDAEKLAWPPGIVVTPTASSTAVPSTALASSTASTISDSTSSSSSAYMVTVNKWRGKMGMSSLILSDQLQGNALKTVTDSDGQMVHELNPGSLAQVLAPGNADEFEKVFVGGWLCEIPSLPGLDGICSTMSQGWSYDGQTGHADILTSKAYSKIGCALNAGIWGCDLA